MTVLKLQSYGRYRPLFSKKVKYPESEEKFCISLRSGSSDVNYEPEFDFTGLSMQNNWNPALQVDLVMDGEVFCKK